MTPAFPPFTGGGERYARSLALELAGRGHVVTVLTSEARSEADFWRPAGRTHRAVRQMDGPLTVIRCPLAGLRGGRPALLARRKLMVMLSALPGDQSRLLSRLARRIPPVRDLSPVLTGFEPPDILFGFNLSWEFPALTGWRYARRRGLPFILVPFAHLGDGKTTRMARNNMMDHQRRLISDADRVLALTGTEVQGFSAWGLSPTNMAVVGSGLDPVPDLPDMTGTLERTRLQPPYVIFVGRVTHDKGAIHSARAVLALRQEGFPVTLALVGQIAPEFARFYGSLGPTEREAIRPLGVLDEEDKHSLLRQAEMLLLPSRTDSFGIVLLEAWIHETPVIGARAGGVAGVINHEEDGLLVPFGDVPALAAAIRRLLEDQGLQERLGQQGRRQVLLRYTWSKVADAVLAQIMPLLRTSPTSGPIGS